jgi:hypothetical protein
LVGREIRTTKTGERYQAQGKQRPLAYPCRLSFLFLPFSRNPSEGPGLR